MKHALATTAFAAASLVALAAHAADDSFAAFYKHFAAAAAADDQKSLAGLTVLGPGLAGSNGPLTFAEIHKAYLTASERRCLAKAMPKGGKDGNGAPEYAAFCGQLIYVFTKTPAGWRWTDLSPDD
jgi:hypothetical protein